MITNKPIVWLYGQVKTPLFSAEARVEAGVLLRKLQKGEHLRMPHNRPIPTIGARCFELRIVDKVATWRIMYKIYSDAIVIGEVFKKKDRTTPKKVIEVCKRRYRKFGEVVK